MKNILTSLLPHLYLTSLYYAGKSSFDNLEILIDRLLQFPNLSVYDISVKIIIKITQKIFTHDIGDTYKESILHNFTNIYTQ